MKNDWLMFERIWDKYNSTQTFQARDAGKASTTRNKQVRHITNKSLSTISSNSVTRPGSRSEYQSKRESLLRRGDGFGIHADETMAKIKAEKRHQRDSRSPSANVSVNISIAKSSISQEPVILVPTSKNPKRQVNFTMEKDYELLDGSASYIEAPNENISIAGRGKASRRDAAIEEKPEKSGRSKDRSKRNKNKANKNGDSDSDQSISPSEFKMKRQFEKGMKQMRQGRDDSLDSLSAAKLRKFLDPENQSILSKATRNVSLTQRNLDRTYNSKESRSEAPKSIRAGTVISHALSQPHLPAMGTSQQA